MLECLDGIDRLYARIWARPLRWLCAATGEDNYFFAILAFLTALGFALFALANGIADHRATSGVVLNGAIVCAISPLWILQSLHLRSSEMSGASAMPGAWGQVRVFNRVLFTSNIFFLIIDLFWGSSIARDISLICLGAGLYFQDERVSKDKGWVKKTLELFGSRLRLTRQSAPSAA